MIGTWVFGSKMADFQWLSQERVKSKYEICVSKEENGMDLFYIR